MDNFVANFKFATKFFFCFSGNGNSVLRISSQNDFIILIFSVLNLENKKE